MHSNEAYRTLGRIMTGFSIRSLCIFGVLITWGNYNCGVIYDEVKTQRRYTYAHYTCGFGTGKDIPF